MGKLMSQSEHLRRFAVGTIDKHERSVRISQREAAELFRIELSVIVAEHHTADHHQDAESVGPGDEQPQRFFPCATRYPRSEIEPQSFGHCGCDCDRGIAEPRTSDLLDRGQSNCASIVLEPALPLLAGVQHIEQIGAIARSVTTSEAIW